MTLSKRLDLHLLLVDAAPDRLAATRESVMAAVPGAVVRTATAPAEALAAVRAEEFDLALLEAQPGDIDAGSLAGLLRQEPGARDLPLIVLADAAPDPQWLVRAGAARIVDVIVRPIEPGLFAHKVAGIVALGAEARRQRRRAARADRLLESNELIVAGLIHDLRTPLMAINLSAEVALVRSQEEAVQQAARRIRSSTTRMMRIFDHLLNLSRVGAEVPEMEFTSGNLHEVAGAVLDDVRAAHPGAKFELTQEGEFAGRFDAALITRSIANLVGTALAHVGHGDPIKVRLDGTHRDRLWLEVSIPAVIPAEVQELMFVPGPGEAGREVAGFGLGLHAIDAFVRAHGGSVVGRSRAPEGTVFELLLPRDAMGAM